MKTRYKIIISNKNIYKEIELSSEAEYAKIGTEIECDFRLHRDLFFEPVCITLNKKDDRWFMICSDNLYISTGDVRKLITKELKHGDNISIRYQNSNNELFKLEFDIDFNDGNIKYERAFDVSSCSAITIGTERTSNIVIRSAYTNNDNIVLKRSNSYFVLSIKNTFNGIYHNGQLAKNGEQIKNGDFLSISDCFFYLKDNKLWTEKGSLVASSSIRYQDTPDLNIYPRFERNTRIHSIVSSENIEILDPPGKPERQKEGIITRLLPSIGMLASAGVMAMMGGISMLIFSGVSALMAIITAIIGVRKNSKDYKKAVQYRKDSYLSYIDQKRKEIKEKRFYEFNELEDIYISSEKEKENFEEFSPDLFDRASTDNDFLCVRLGSGDVIANQRINYKKGEKLEVEDELQKMPSELCEEFKYISDAPIICDFKSVNAIGVTGSEENRFEMFKVIVLDLIARHHYKDLKMYFIAEEKNSDKVRWCRMLPYVYNDVLGIPNIVCNDESKSLIFENLYKELTNRSVEKSCDNHIIVFLYDEYGFSSHPISKFVDLANKINVTFVFFGNDIAHVDAGCGYLIDVSDFGKGVLIDASNKNNSTDFYFSPISTEYATNIVDFIAPIYTEEISLESSLTKNISLFELLKIMTVEDIDLTSNWNSSEVYKSMNAPIGVSKSGVVGLDIHDKAHGPHGLVAGTTGSGKSEILQTYILSMILRFHPYEVAFVIIDFKGGGMVNQFIGIPHLLGAITNIDGKAINRSLKSIRAELQKRQRYFAEADVNHIDKYIKKYKKGQVQKPLPHLIIIVDEFAELKAEQPEFMKELISAARIGRSLGVHLILATQKPSGQVDDQIWSNSKFKLCLKVQDQSDSNEVLKSPLAAEIKEPGRAYFQVGNNEIFELFQSAYSGAPEKSDDSGVKEFSIDMLTPTGKRIQVFKQTKEKKSEGNLTQLDAVVQYVKKYTEAHNIKKLSNICLPDLPTRIIVPKESYERHGGISIGLYDDPDNQYQGDVVMNFDTNNTVILGAAQTGKTNLLELIIMELAKAKKANQANFYIMDFGSMILKNFESLNHVGGVITSSEEEKLKNFFNMMSEEIAKRKEKLLSVGVSSFSSYIEAGKTDLANLYVILDNFAVFKELYSEKFEDEFLYLTREGVTYGLSVIVSISSTNGFGYKYLSNFSNFIALSCNDSSEYSNLFDRCRVEPSNIPGRALFSKDKNIYEFQSYLCFSDDKEFERVKSMKSFIQTINSNNEGVHAKRIPEIPDEFNLSYISENYDVDVKRNIAVALDYLTIRPMMIDFYNQCQIALCGKNTSSMNNYLKSILEDVRRNYFSRETDVYIIDSLTRDLNDYSDEVFVKDYTTDYSLLSNIFESVNIQLEQRYEDVVANGFGVLEKYNLIMLIINNKDAFGYISDERNLMRAYESFVDKLKAMKIFIILSGIEDKPIGYSSPDMLKKIKDDKHMLVFTNASEHKILDIPIAFIRQNKKPLDSTQAFYINESEISRIKFAKEGE